MAAAVALISAVAATEPVRAGFIDLPDWTLALYAGTATYDHSYAVSSAVPLGARAGFTFLGGRFGLEGNYGKSHAEAARVSDRKFPIDQLGLDLTFDFVPEAWINPYVFAGWARLTLDEPGHEVLHMSGYEAGGGVKMRLRRDPLARWDLRVDARGIKVENGSTLEGAGQYRESVYLTVGLMLTRAGREAASDRDRDRVPDRVDRCPDTPRGARVDSTGCPTDADGDGVPDGIDLCAATPHGMPVDAVGCAVDTDGDGVFDGVDLCPGTPPRVLVDGDGCPLPPRIATVEAELLDAGYVVLEAGAFAPGSAMLRPASQALLDEIGRVLSAWPELSVAIQGLADSVEAGAKAQDLAERRAKAVRDNLLARRPDLRPDRFSVAGREVPPGPTPGSTAGQSGGVPRVEIRTTNPGAAPPKR